MLDRATVTGLIERIEVLASVTGKALGTLVDDFQIGRVRGLLQKIEDCNHRGNR